MLRGFLAPPIVYTYTMWHACVVNKTIYIRDEDVPVWDRAKELAGEKLAPIIVEGLKKFVIEKKLEQTVAKGFERIVLSFQDADDNLIPKKKAFSGKWIIPPVKPLRVTSEDGNEADFFYCVATTPKDAAVFYYWSEDGEHFYGKHFAVFSSLRAAAADSNLRWVTAKAIEQIGVPVEELDI